MWRKGVYCTRLPQEKDWPQVLVNMVISVPWKAGNLLTERLLAEDLLDLTINRGRIYFKYSCLFDDVSTSAYTSSNGRVISEKLI
jgi:hypothetical protein